MRLRMLCLQAESRRGDMNGMVLGQFAGDLWGRTVEDYTGSEPRRRDCTRVLSGLPINKDVGSHWVNVSVDDGNGGWGWSSFILTVKHVNHPPKIITKNITTCYEDHLYSVVYNATDPDKKPIIDKLNWTTKTNATWLTIHKGNNSFSGIPDNSNVGFYYVNVTVRDSYNATDFHNFTLRVINTPPTIVPRENITDIRILENKSISLHFDTDDEGQGHVTWHLKTNGAWLHIDSISGNVTGSPTHMNIGIWRINVSVDDGNGGWNWTNFTIKVIGINHPPLISYISDQNTTVDLLFSYKVNATDIDSDILEFSLSNPPNGMKIDSNTGQITWIPAPGQEGKYSITVKVWDHKNQTTRTFVIIVQPHFIINVIFPKNGQIVSGTIISNGTYQGPNNTALWINIDNKEWINVSTNNKWSYPINTKGLQNGNHTIQFKATWGSYQSPIITRTIIIKNAKQINNHAMDEYVWMLWLFIAILLIAALILVYQGLKKEKDIIIIKKKRKGPRSPEAPSRTHNGSRNGTGEGERFV